MFISDILVAMEEIIIKVVMVIFAVGISVILHEVVHGYVAKYLGDTTAEEEGRLTLNPIVHIDPVFTLLLPVILAIAGAPIFGAAKPVPVQGHRLRWDEFGMALVAVMGPLTNLVLAFVGGLILAFINVDSLFWVNWWVIFIQVNIGFFIFNMLPIPPLDGSRVLYAFAPEPLQRVMRQIEPYGIFILLGLVMLGMPLIGSAIKGIYSALFTTIINISG